MNTENKTSYPLCWPDGWQRTPKHKITYSRFNREGNNRGHTLARVRYELAREIDRLGATNAVISTNAKLRLDGQPASGLKQPDDRGAAVYFTLKGKPVSLACDKWDRVECNIWAIVKHIEALRGQERWGVGNVEQAFRGYTALPEKATASNWWEVLGVAVNASAEQVKDAYRILVKKHHPDMGGDAELFRRVQSAWEEFSKLQTQ